MPNVDWFSFDPDRGRGRAAVMSPLLATGAIHDHHRACDCVVIINRGRQLTVLYLDLKSGNPTGYSGQSLERALVEKDGVDVRSEVLPWQEVSDPGSLRLL